MLQYIVLYEEWDTGIRLHKCMNIGGLYLHLLVGGGCVEYFIFFSFCIYQDGETPLITAIEYGNFEMVEQLLNANADPNMRTVCLT